MNNIRLQKFLSNSGYCSRRKAEELIKAGKVKIIINCEEPKVHLRGGLSKVAKIGDKINPENDIIKINGKIIKPQKKYIYYALNKPVGYTSTVRDKHAKRTVLDLVSKNPRIYPVGRLDKNSEGLMILTNDGELANKLTHPRFEHEKEYLVKCQISNVKCQIKIIIKKLKKGIRLKEGLAKFDKIEIISIDQKKHTVLIKVVLHQGWKRQIRRMCERVGLSVLDLKRIRIGKLELGDLEKGKYKIIKKEDII